MLTEDNALQFAIMIEAGVPPSHAILYFAESDDPAEVAAMTSKWMRSRLVKQAILKLMGSPWHKLSLDERCKHALDNHYSQLAYLLHSEHYATADTPTKQKLDTARAAIEAKLAGVAGKTDVLSAFLDDVRSGRLKVGRPVPVAILPS